MKPFFAAGLALLGLLAGCSQTKDRQVTASTTSVTSLPLPIPGVDGRFLSLGGESIYDAGLYELRLWPVRMDPLTPVRRVSSLDACESQVIVAAAQAEVGYTDHLQVFSGGKFSPVEALGSPHAFSPKLAPDCRMLYLDYPESNRDAKERVHVWNPAERSDTVVASYPGVGGTSWGPGGQIAVVERTPVVQGKEQDDLIVHILKNGTRRSIPAPAPRLAGLYWGAANWMAFSNYDGDATIFLQPDTGERHDLAGWAAQAWSPDGQLLLVTAPDKRRLGIVELPDFSTVKPLGEAPIPVHDIIWLPVGSDPVGPIATG